VFLELFQVVTTFVHANLPNLMALVLGANRLMAMAKNNGGLHLIVVNEVFLQLISRSIVLQFCGPF